jgi:hypothetical protein
MRVVVLLVPPILAVTVVRRPHPIQLVTIRLFPNLILVATQALILAKIEPTTPVLILQETAFLVLDEAVVLVPEGAEEDTNNQRTEICYSISEQHKLL